MRIAVTLVGSRVRRMIAAPRDGAVIAVFRRSLYVRDGAGAIACVGVAGLGAGPLNALCEGWPAEPVAADQPTRWHGSTLCLANSCQFDLAAAETWRPALPPRSADLGAGLARLADAAAVDVPARGFGRMIGALVRGAPATASDPFERAGIEGVAALSQWIAGPDGEPPAAVERLIGLGPGLTPSGDDALGGALVALRAVGQSPAADALVRWLLPRARIATSDISFAHLAAAADGEGAAALHDTLNALAGADRAGLTAGLRRLDAVGHSSGWDALAGAVSALVALRRA